MTHAHIDHVGGAMKLKRLTGAPVLLNQNDHALLKMLDVQATWIGMPTPEAVTIDQSVTTGDQLRAGSLVADVLHTPGHTEGGICLYFAVREKADCGRYLVGRIDWSDRPSRRLVREDHALAAWAGSWRCRTNSGRARTRTGDDDRRGTGKQSIPGR